MELSSKEKVLLAIYLEYQNDIPDMDKNVRHEFLGMTLDVFNINLVKLENEGLINELAKSYAGKNKYITYLKNVKPSCSGLHYVENKLINSISDDEIEKKDLENLDPEKKEKIIRIRKIIAIAAKWGWNEIKDIGLKMYEINVKK